MSATLVLKQLDESFEYLARLERRLAGIAQRLQGARGQSAFWKGPRGFEVRSARYDAAADEFVVGFQSGREYRLPASAIKLSAPVKKARLDEFKHGVVVYLADGTETSFASDLVLHECEPTYRAAHQRPRGAKESDFGARIRALRLSVGLQAKEVAAAAGLAASNYARLEGSKHQPRVETLVRVAKALGVPLADLIGSPESKKS